MSSVRTMEFYDELRNARENMAMVAVASVLLNPKLLNTALAETELMLRDGKMLRKNEDCLDFLFSEFDPKKHLRNPPDRFFSYVESVLKGKAAECGYAKEHLLTVADIKTVEAMLIYAACFKVETEFEMKLAVEYALQVQESGKYEPDTVEAREAQRILESIKKSSHVISEGDGLSQKYETIIILLKQLTNTLRNKNAGQQIPGEIKLSIIITINDQLSEIKSWKDANVYQMFFGGYVKAQIETKEQKVKFLQRLLAADNLVDAKMYALLTLKNNRAILEGGRTLERATEVMDVKIEEAARDINDTANIEMSEIKDPQRKTALPLEPQGEDISPSISPNNQRKQ